MTALVRPDVRLICGDALEVLRTLPDESVDLCVTSPPYGTTIRYDNGRWPTGRGLRPNMRVRGDTGSGGGGVPADRYADWFLPVVAEIARLLAPGAVFALNLAGQGTATYPEEIVMRAVRDAHLTLHDRVCWVKLNAIPTRSRATHLIPEWEPIYLFRRGPLAHFNRDDIRRPYSASTLRRVDRKNLHSGQQGHHAAQDHPYVRGEKPEYAHPAGRDAPNVLRAAPEQSSRWPHPARFPEALPEFFIAAYCPEGGMVLDPFVGSGTTCAVAARLGRDSIGIDLSPDYIAMAERRVAPYRDQTKLDLQEASR